jgi:hypothetical protein
VSTPIAPVSTTAVIDLERPIAEEQDITLPLQMDNYLRSTQSTYPSSFHDKKGDEILVKQKRIEEMLVKQKKQIFALYEMQKSVTEQIAWIVNQMKQNKKDEDELSPKVFMVSKIIFIILYDI